MATSFDDSNLYRQALQGYDNSQKMVGYIDELLGELAETHTPGTPDWLQRTVKPNDMVKLSKDMAKLVPNNNEIFRSTLTDRAQLMRNKSFQLADQEIAKAAALLFAPSLTPPNLPPTRIPVEKALAKLNPVLTLLELLTQTTDLNSNESAELAARRKLPPTITR